MSNYVHLAMIELEQGHYQRYLTYMALHRGQRTKRKAIREKWDREQDLFLRRNYETMSDRLMAMAIGRTEEAVKYRRKKLQLNRQPERRRWSEKEDDYLRENYKALSLKEMGAALDRKPKQISNRMSKLGLSKIRRYSFLINGQAVATGTISEIAKATNTNKYTVKRWRTSGNRSMEFIEL